MKNMTGRIGLAALAAIVGTGLYVALREQPVSVDAAPVIEGPMIVTINQEGVTRVRNVYTVSAPIAGHLDRTSLEEGDPVEANRTVVASIHPMDPPLIDRRTEAELLAAIEAARSGVAQAELNSAKARLMRPGDEILDIEGRECCVEVTAPIDGIVLSVRVKSEQAVAAGTPLAEVGDPRDLEIAVDLLSEDAVRIRPGLKATIIDWGGEENLDATVRRVDPSAFTKVSALGIEEQRVNAVLDLDRPEPLLGHGYRVFARLAIWRSEKALQAPIAALFRTSGNWAVFRIVDDRAELVPVEIGHLNDESAEVTAGLSRGDRVVLHPSDTLDDGGLVAPRTDR